MSDSINGFTVIFKDSVSEEYMDKVENAISLMKGVVKVERVVEGVDSFIAASQENSRIRNFLLDCIRTDFNRIK